MLDEVVATCERIGNAAYRARAFNSMGWIYGEIQDHERAIEWNTLGIQAALAINAPDPEIENNARLNLVVRGDATMALRYADECLALAEQSESRKNIVKARRLRGQVFLARDDLASAERELLIALEIAQRIGNPPQLWKAYAALGELRAAQGRADDARAAYAEALAVIDGVAAGLTDAELRETFLGSAHVQGIRQAAMAL
jgi:tetratricopeptide (TPR) repeat protein